MKLKIWENALLCFNSFAAGIVWFPQHPFAGGFHFLLGFVAIWLMNNNPKPQRHD